MAAEGGLPPAWIQTEGGAFWLGYSTYCWTAECADCALPACQDTEFVPEIDVRAGETVRAHFGFEPSITLFPTGDPDDPTPLEDVVDGHDLDPANPAWATRQVATPATPPAFASRRSRSAGRS